ATLSASPAGGGGPAEPDRRSRRPPRLPRRRARADPLGAGTLRPCPTARRETRGARGGRAALRPAPAWPPLAHRARVRGAGAGVPATTCDTPLRASARA